MLLAPQSYLCDQSCDLDDPMNDFKDDTLAFEILFVHGIDFSILISCLPSGCASIKGHREELANGRG